MLLAVTALAGCTDSSDYDNNTQETVAVGLSFSVSSSAGHAASRLHPTVIQDNTAFRGIQGLRIIPFGVRGAITSSDMPKAFQIDGVADADYDRRESANAWFYYYEHCSFTSGTASFLAYGRAVPATDPLNGSSEIANKAYNGSIVADIDPSGIPAKTGFTLEQILTDNTAPDEAVALANYLSGIANTVGDGDGYSAERVWSLTSEPSLKSLFLSFTNQTNDGTQPFAGSGRNVSAHIAALRLLLDGVTVSTTEHQALLDKLKEKTSAEMPAALREYPAAEGLPDGAAVLRWNGSAFVAETETTTLAHINNISRYAYPAELYYYGNSQIYTSNNGVGGTAYAAATSWAGVLDNYEYKDGAVISTNTRAVALVDPLQYAVACLRLNIKGTTTTLTDAKGTAITVGSTTFPLTGIIVGGQMPLGFDFKPKTPYSELEARFVYDKHVTDGSGNTIYLTAGSGVTESTATLVLQSYDDNEVPVVLEFANNSDKDFTGLNGKIYRGTRFYLVGVIKPSDASSGVSAATEGRVFTRDYTTSLTVKIESLAKAYNVLPDLLTPRLEMGVQFMTQWIQSTPTDIQLD